MRSFASIVVLSLSAAVAFAAPTAEPEAVQLEARQSCPDVQAYFARGTGESGTLGTVVGPDFSRELSSALRGKSVTFTGISYPASVSGYNAGGDRGGARTMANSVTSTANRCPNTKIVISGYRSVTIILLQARYSEAECDSLQSGCPGHLPRCAAALKRYPNPRQRCCDLW
jgi:hypothetical protein